MSYLKEVSAFALHNFVLLSVRVTTLVDDAMGMEKGLKMGADKFSSIITAKNLN